MQTENKDIFQARKLPPFGYFIKIMWRHGLWAIIISLPIAVLIVLGLSRIEISYPSKATVIYDPRDSAITNTFVLYPEFSQIGNTFLAALADKAFLQTLGRKLGYFDIDAPYYRKPWYIKPLSKIVPKSLTPQSWSYDEEEYKAHVIQSQIKEKLKGRVTSGTYELELEGRGASPEAAQLLVTEAFNTFVEFQLREALSRIQASIETYDSYLQQEKKRLEEMSDVYSIYDSSELASGQTLNLSRQQKQQLKNRERNLITRILDRQGELEQTFESQVRRKLELEAELQSLLTRRGATHPEVVQKRRELEELGRSRKTNSLNQEIDSLTRELLQLQARLRRAGVPIDLTLQLRNMTEEGQLFVTRLSQQVKEFKLEQQNLENQLKQQEGRTRYRYTKTPSLESTPANKKVLLLSAAVGGLIILLTAGSVIVFREYYNPVACDEWRLVNRFALPVISQFPRKDLKALAKLNPSRIRQTKGRISMDKPGASEESVIRILQNVRYIEQSFIRAAANGIHSIVYVGQHAELGALSRTIANCCAIDQDQGIILLDCNHINPAVHNRASKDLLDFLNGDCKWKDVKVSSNEQQAFDYAFHSIKAQNAEALKLDTMKKLLSALKEKYQLLLFNGFPGGLFVENARLIQHADSWVLGIVVGSARYDEIEAAIQAIDPSKLKGMVLIHS